MVVLDRSSFDSYEKSGRLRDIHFAQEHGWVKSRYGDSFIFDVPCGHCINCRLNYARKWSQRCLLESMLWSENFFVTFTYEDENLVIVGDYDLATLIPDDVTKFFKRLREYYRDKYNHTGIRFYMAGEYGDTTFRPHYHVICFNLPIFDLKYYSKSPLGDVYYNSPTLDKLWGKGHVVVGEVTAQSVAYTARYCQKKATKDIDYAELGIKSEYVRMSRNPGIGVKYLEDNVEKIYENDAIYLPNGQIATPCRLFDEKASSLGIDVDSVKNRRILNAVFQSNQRVDMVSKDYYQYMDDLEQEYLKRSRALGRGMC